MGQQLEEDLCGDGAAALGGGARAMDETALAPVSLVHVDTSGLVSLRPHHGLAGWTPHLVGGEQPTGSIPIKNSSITGSRANSGDLRPRQFSGLRHPEIQT
jgi:hypothetical protein